MNWGLLVWVALKAAFILSTFALTVYAVYRLAILVQ